MRRAMPSSSISAELQCKLVRCRNKHGSPAKLIAPAIERGPVDQIAQGAVCFRAEDKARRQIPRGAERVPKRCPVILRHFHRI